MVYKFNTLLLDPGRCTIPHQPSVCPANLLAVTMPSPPVPPGPTFPVGPCASQSELRIGSEVSCRNTGQRGSTCIEGPTSFDQQKRLLTVTEYQVDTTRLQWLLRFLPLLVYYQISHGNFPGAPPSPNTFSTTPTALSQLPQTEWALPSSPSLPEMASTTPRLVTG